MTRAADEALEELMDSHEFEERVGSAPEQDDLERANCPLAGQWGHLQCGICQMHGLPRFSCWQCEVK
jgi:hypothetical protein